MGTQSVRAIQKTFSQAVQRTSDHGRTVTVREVRRALQAARADDGKVDSREVNAVAYNVSFNVRGQGKLTDRAVEELKAFYVANGPMFYPVRDSFWTAKYDDNGNPR